MAKLQAAGINLSSFGIERRPMLALAKEEGEGVVSVRLSPMASFGGKIKLMDPLDDLFARWRKDLLELPRPIAVDVPLDLQGLGARGDSRFIWELTHRPMDFAFYQDAPLTDRIGVFNVRFLELLGRSQFTPGKDFIEVSPQACTEFFDFRGIYKGGRAHQAKAGHWKADDSTQSADKAFTKVVHELGFNIENTAEGRLDSGDVDAILCALTALTLAKGGHTVTGPELARVIAERVARRMNMEPEAFAKLEAPRACHALAQPYWQAVLITRV